MTCRDDIKISQLNLFGTHDSLTAFVDMEKMSRCQALTLKEQLNLGVRLIDIRLNKKRGSFFLVHSLADCYADKEKKIPLSFSAVFEECLSFLKENPEEFLVLSIKQDRGLQSRFFFPAFYEKYIRGREKVWYLGEKIPCIGECKGKLVLMRRCKTLPSFKKNNGCGLDFSRWRDQGKKGSEKIYPVILNDTQKAVVQDRYSLEPQRKWHKCAKPFLDKCKADENNICLHFISTAFRYKNESLTKTAKEMNELFKAYPLFREKGWFFFDFPDEEIAKKMKESNNR